MGNNKLLQIVEVAKLYYQLDYNQHDIAKKLGISRPTVSRLLQQAKKMGIVKIEIIDPSETMEELAEQLKEKYQLKKAFVAAASQNEDSAVKAAIGKRTADFLYETVSDGDIIGVTWGRTLYNVALELKHKPLKDVEVVQLKGGVSHSKINTYASEIVYLFGKAFDTIPQHLPLPAIVDHVAVKKALEADRHIQKLLDMGRKANIALFTVGSVNFDSLLFQLGYLSDEELEMLSNEAVGDICSRFFDKDGNIVSESLNERTIGIDLSELQKKEKSILVAGGTNKIKAIKGALKGKYANILITDQYTARALLDEKS
ncbi:deoxyribonucleoside regulator [Anoxybacillus calidus]|jgi:deoxyribonucleoside regulator|uniref:Deoxyribonucleoside regulator n=1 Tax=[Anoxybacillus] calidus TaxID=575178 RepID=A0A7V9YXY9_9BACL|nr:sugar-binding transcriptional regulator [Anoxybacillus calidus]MBA2870297.1 deoxyribonucleoside regulator [Anoxybacillus calidus]